MATVEDFKHNLQTRITAAANAPRWPMSDVEEYMAQFGRRRERFDEAARSLVTEVVQPRLEALLAAFPSARLMTDERGCRCWCWFAASHRFPVTAKVEFAIETDEASEHVHVRYEAYLMPVFFKFQPHDKLTLPVEQIDRRRITDWVEERIFEFLDAYLRYDRGADDLDEDLVTDPVCGMRLRRSGAGQQAEHRGHAYFFCSLECREKFERRPADFVALRTI